MNILRILSICLAFLAYSPPAHAEKRFGLLIGNSNYQVLPKFNDAGNDARLVTRMLKDLKFETFTATDLDREAMQRELRSFSARVRAAGDNSVAIVFYAGHGTQVGGENYIIPVDASKLTKANTSRYALSVTDVMAELDSSAAFIKVLVLDACRDEPSRSITIEPTETHGFRAVRGSTGTIIAYSTMLGALAKDGEGANSPFTEELAGLLTVPNISGEELLIQLQDRVHRRTGGTQVPWFNVNLGGRSFSFNPLPGVAIAPRPVPAVRPSEACSIPRGSYRVVGVDLWDHLNVRAAPDAPKWDGNSPSNVVMKLDAEQGGIEVVDCPGGQDWCRIRFLCREGYVSRRYIALGAPASGTGVAGFASQGEHRIDIGRSEMLMVREGPSHKSPIVTQLVEGSRGVSVQHCIVPRGSTNSWCFVSIGSLRGWSNGLYLRSVSSGSRPTISR